MSIQTENFRTVRATMPDAQCTIRQGRREFSTAICPGIDRQRMDSDQGQFEAVNGSVRYIKDEVPSGMDMDHGKLIEVKVAGNSEFVKYRIAGTAYDQGGVAHKTLEWPHE